MILKRYLNDYTGNGNDKSCNSCNKAQNSVSSTFIPWDTPLQIYRTTTTRHYKECL